MGDQLATLVRQDAGAPRDIPGVGLLEAFHEGFCAELRRGAGRAIDVQGGIAPAQPAAHPERRGIAQVVRVQMAGEDLVDPVEFGPHGEEVLHRTAADVEQEDIAVAQLHIPGR